MDFIRLLFAKISATTEAVRDHSCSQSDCPCKPHIFCGVPNQNIAQGLHQHDGGTTNDNVVRAGYSGHCVGHQIEETAVVGVGSTLLQSVMYDTVKRSVRAQW